MDKAFQCDLLDVLQNDDKKIAFMQKWISLCREFQSCVITKVEKKLLHKKDCNEKKCTYNKKVQQEINMIQSNIDDIIQEQKITDKKVFNAIKLQENLMIELEEDKALRDNLLLEMVDLQQEQEIRKKEKLLKWGALKRAYNIYKSHLNIHISLEEENDCQRVKVSFFPYSKFTKEYFVQLLFSDDQWSVERLEPKLKKEHFNELGIAMNSSERSKVLELTLFLCQLRSIFLKYYMEKEETANHNADKLLRC